MIVSDQQEVIHALSLPAFHGEGLDDVERIDTHISVVFLAGSRALKLKRAVKFDYVDFSTLERRRTACEAEVTLNRRTAPTLYRGVVAITRASNGALQLGGDGTPVDYVVDMARFDQSTLFDRLAGRGQLTRELMTALAEEVATYHEGAAPRPDHGGRQGMAWVVEGNATGLATHEPEVFDATLLDQLTGLGRAALERHGPTLDARRDRGLVRQCHGDLHLRNICLVEGRPTLFDAIEFNDELSCIDTAYDLAFLLMDLRHRHLTTWANLVLNEYLRHANDLEALALLPLFLSCRAAVRAKIGADAADVQTHLEQVEAMRAEAREYLRLAVGCLRPPAPCLIAIGGLSGTGKSTLAAHLAPRLGPVPGALVLRSDVIRKRLWGARSLVERLPQAAYAHDVSRRVYDTLGRDAARALGAGHSVIADAVFLDPEERLNLERVAADAGARFHGVWLNAPTALLTARLDARVNDASDATTSVLHQQQQRDPGDIRWARLDAAQHVERVAALVAGALAPHGLLSDEPQLKKQPP